MYSLACDIGLILFTNGYGDMYITPLNLLHSIDLVPFRYIYLVIVIFVSSVTSLPLSMMCLISLLLRRTFVDLNHRIRRVIIEGSGCMGSRFSEDLEMLRLEHQLVCYRVKQADLYVSICNGLCSSTRLQTASPFCTLMQFSLKITLLPKA